MSRQCLRCGADISGKIASARYCGVRCRGGYPPKPRLDANAEKPPPEAFAVLPKPHQGSAENASVSPSVAKSGRRGRKPPFACTCTICGQVFEHPTTWAAKLCSEPCRIEAARQRSAERAAIAAEEAAKIEARKAKLAAENSDPVWVELKARWKAALKPFDLAANERSKRIKEWA